MLIFNDGQPKLCQKLTFRYMLTGCNTNIYHFTFLSINSKSTLHYQDEVSVPDYFVFSTVEGIGYPSDTILR